MDYDDYNGFGIFGCASIKTPTCYGNACYMSKFFNSLIYLNMS